MSGVQDSADWLSDLPKSWTSPALSVRYNVALGKMVDEKKSTRAHLVPYLRNVDVQWDAINYQMLPEIDIRPDEEHRYFLRTGDLLVCEGGEPGRAAIWDGALSPCAYQKALHRLRPISKDEHARYLLYVLKALVTTGIIGAAQGKSTIGHLPAEDFRRMRLPKPPIAEQVAIVDFLDRETAEADALVAKYERLIELLEEKRIALITQAVTKGLDARVPMRDSGVDWIGDVPKTWEVLALKKIARLSSGYAFPSELFSPEGVPAVQMSNLKSGILELDDAKCIPETACRDDVALAAGDLLIGMSGSIGNFARVRETDLPCQLNQRVGRFKTSPAILADYLELFIQTPAFAIPILLAATGTAQLNISPGSVGNVEIPVPPVIEQRSIVRRIADDQSRISRIMLFARSSVTLIRERRSALITAAVTGQIDVNTNRSKKQQMEVPA